MTQRQIQPTPQTTLSNLDVMAGIYGHWSGSKGGTAEDVLSHFDPDIEMRSILTADLPHEIAGFHHGIAEAQNYFASLGRDSQMERYQVGRLIGDEDLVVMVGDCAWRYVPLDFVVDTPKVDVWRLRDGRITHFMEYFDSLAFARGIGAIPGGANAVTPRNVAPPHSNREPGAPPDPAIAALKRTYVRWRETNGANAPEFLALMHPDVAMHSVLDAASFPGIGGSKYGIAAVQTYFALLGAGWEMLFHKIDRFVTDADDLVMIGACAWRHRLTGKVFHSPKLDLCHVEDGRVTWFLEMFDSLAFARATAI